MKAKYTNTVFLLLGLALIAELIILLFQTGTVNILGNRAERLKAYVVAESDDRTILPGDIYDRNGNTIAYTDYITQDETSDNGESVSMTKRTTVYTDGNAFSQTVGYTGPKVYIPFETSLEEVASARLDSGLMGFLNDTYWGDNGLYKTTDIDGTKGQSATLTLDSNLQMKVYEALSSEMDSSECIGSAVVMNVHTGEILADVSFPTYDYNNLANAKAQMDIDEEEKGLEPGYPVTYKNAKAPGSIMKVLTSIALIDHGMGDFTTENSTYTMDSGWSCKAVEYHTGFMDVSLGDTLDMETALNISSNVYYSKAALELGAERLQETAEKFMLTEDSSEISTDFGNVQYNWDLDVEDDVLAQTGFGQGKTELTTIHAAMITQAIANDGIMMKPYMVKELIDANGKTVYEGEEEVLSVATSKETANQVKSMMRSTADICCKLHDLVDEYDVFSKYQICGKTGTAETGDVNNSTNAWYISFAPYDNPQYVVVVNQCKCDKSGYQMMSVVSEIYRYLFEEYGQ